jgi:hypothetical protein
MFVRFRHAEPWLQLSIGSAAHAATISIKPAANGEPALVTVDGDLQANDGDQFRSKTGFLSKAIVSFRSAGGSVVAGIQIGESIRLKGFTTEIAGSQTRFLDVTKPPLRRFRHGAVIATED